MGDPAGVGPEVLIKGFKKARETHNLVAISDFSKIRPIADRYNVPVQKINYIDEVENFKDHLNILHLEYGADFSAGQFDQKNSFSVIESIRIATQLCLKKEVGAMVTGPINKSILRSHEAFKFSGHTDFLEHLCGCGKDTAIMMMLNNFLKIIPLTIHEPLDKVSIKIKEANIEKKIGLIISELKKYFYSKPKIAVLGFNPHAGEEGQIGNEEISDILPAILKFQKTITTKLTNTKIRTKGRHDPCVGIRCVPVAEAMVALVLADHLLRNYPINKKVKKNRNAK